MKSHASEVSIAITIVLCKYAYPMWMLGLNLESTLPVSYVMTYITLALELGLIWHLDHLGL